MRRSPGRRSELRGAAARPGGVPRRQSFLGDPCSVTATVLETAVAPPAGVKVTTTETRRLGERASSAVAALLGLIVIAAAAPEPEPIPTYPQNIEEL